jgi:23S rRNA pseudouridine1911/1915/1917 synthase
MPEMEDTKSKISKQFAFQVLDESEDWLVVDKAAPLQIHPSKPGDGWTLWHGLVDLLAYELANGGQVSIINRLDRETSGTVLVAKQAAAARRLGLAMQERRIHKVYQAIVHGWPEWEHEQVVQAPILRRGEVRPSEIWVKQCVHECGVSCETRLRLLKRWQHPVAGALSLIEARPITGRMHQIRVHVAHLGFPILGDKLYGLDERCYLEFIDTGWTPALEQKLHFSRQALHSAQLEVELDGQLHVWQAPLPESMRAWL